MIPLVFPSVSSIRCLRVRRPASFPQQQEHSPMATKTPAAPTRAAASKTGAGTKTAPKTAGGNGAAVKPASLLLGPVAAGQTARPMSRGAVYKWLRAQTGLTSQQIASVFDQLTELIEHQLGKKGPGVFAIHGLLKMRVVRKPATKARKGINPFTKEEQLFKAKPARNVVRAIPLQKLKELV
jgi:nucleoid DNA-binding protein